MSKNKRPIITHGVIILEFKCSDETIQNILNNLYHNNEDFIHGMSFFQFKDDSTSKEIYKVIEHAKGKE